MTSLLYSYSSYLIKSARLQDEHYAIELMFPKVSIFPGQSSSVVIFYGNISTIVTFIPDFTYIYNHFFECHNIYAYKMYYKNTYFNLYEISVVAGNSVKNFHSKYIRSTLIRKVNTIDTHYYMIHI